MFLRFYYLLFSIMIFIRADFTYIGKIATMQATTITIDYTPLIINKINCTFLIQAKLSNSSEILITMKQTNCNYLPESKQIYRIWNFQARQIQYITTLSVDFSNIKYLDLYKSQLYFKQEKGYSSNSYLLAVLLKSDIENIILPFNLLNQKTIRVFVNEIGNTQLNNNKTITAQPYLKTYWNQIGQTQIVMPWLPYFSNCQKQSSRLFLDSLIQPSNCHMIKDLFGFISKQCVDQQLSFKCILEQTNIGNSVQIPWWKTSNQIIYYLQAQQISANQLLNYFTNPSSKTNFQSKIYKKLVSVEYKPRTTFPTNPNIFQLEIQVILENNKIKIVQAQMVTQYNKQSNLQFPQVQLIVKITYLSFFDQIWDFHGNYVTIGFFCLLFNSLVILLIYLVLIKLNLNFNFKSKLKLIIFPIGKGYFYSIISGLTFILLFYMISDITSFSLISTTFNGDDITNLSACYLGRNGLILMVAGLYLLNAAINQSFKVTSFDETKIILHDDLGDIHGEHNHNKQNFIIKNLYSQRKYLLLFILVMDYILLYLYEVFISFSFTNICLMFVFVYPLIQKLIITLYRHLIIKQLLYLHGIIIVYQTFFNIFLLQTNTLNQFYVLYFLKIFSEIIISIFYQIILEYICNKLNQFPDRNFITLNIWNFYQNIIRQIVQESPYQKALFYGGIITSKIGASFLKPIFMLIIYLTLEQTQIYKDFTLQEDCFLRIWTALCCTIPLEILLLFFLTRFLQIFLKIKILQVINFSNFKFKKRKIKWMNDVFSQNRNIKHFYREFEKFNFSSQLYLVSFLLSLSILTTIIAIKAVFQSRYIVYEDPALLVIFSLVWGSGIISSFLVSFIVIKLRLYQKKQQGKMRTKLENIQQILKKKNYQKYLQLDLVKNHFLTFNKEWIIQNLASILTQQDFEQNNYKLLNKYKFYKSISKKVNLQAEKKKQFTIQQKQIQQDYMKSPFITIPMHKYNKFAKPIIYRWYYMAKQNIYLKNLIQTIKKQKSKPICQFCDMDIQLQAVEKRQFSDIVNEFRVINVGRIFNQDHFRQFYRYHQEFITVCVDCKYKKRHLQKKNIKNAKGAASNLVLRWLILTRSKNLHKKIIV